MGNMFSSPSPPPPPPAPIKPPPIPDITDPAVVAAKSAAQANQQSMGGRQSTILTKSATRPTGDYAAKTLG